MKMFGIYPEGRSKYFRQNWKFNLAISMILTQNVPEGYKLNDIAFA